MAKTEAFHKGRREGKTVTYRKPDEVVVDDFSSEFEPGAIITVDGSKFKDGDTISLHPGDLAQFDEEGQVIPYRADAESKPIGIVTDADEVSVTIEVAPGSLTTFRKATEDAASELAKIKKVLEEEASVAAERLLKRIELEGEWKMDIDGGFVGDDDKPRSVWVEGVEVTVGSIVYEDKRGWSGIPLEVLEVTNARVPMLVCAGANGWNVNGTMSKKHGVRVRRFNALQLTVEENRYGSPVMRDI